MSIGIAGSSAAYHANDRRSSKPQHGYVIKDKSGNIWEYGISGTEVTVDENGKKISPRAQNKLHIKYAGDTNMTYEIIKEGMKNRQEAIDWEKEQVRQYGKVHKDTPRGQGRPSWHVMQRNADRAKAALRRRFGGLTYPKKRK